jgi:hypothetical protein
MRNTPGDLLGFPRFHSAHHSNKLYKVLKNPPSLVALRCCAFLKRSEVRAAETAATSNLTLCFQSSVAIVAIRGLYTFVKSE